MAMTELRALSVGEILDGGITLYRRHFGLLMGISIVTYGLPTLLSIYITQLGGAFLHPWWALLVFLFKSIGMTFATAAIVWVLSEVYLGRTPDMGAAFGHARARFWKLVWAWVARSLVVGIGLVLFLVPGIIAACAYAVVVPVVVLERLDSGTDALGRSSALTKGYKGKAFILGVVVFLLIYLPMVAGGGVAAILGGGEQFIDILAEIVSFVATPVFASVVTLFYYDLRVRQEAFDLEHMSAALDLAVAEA